MAPAKATGRTGTMDATETIMNIIRPPYRSVSAPTGMRPSDPTRIGVATSNAVCVLDSDMAPAYGVDSGPIRFQAQKLIAKVQVARARFRPCPAIWLTTASGG